MSVTITEQEMHDNAQSLAVLRKGGRLNSMEADDLIEYVERLEKYHNDNKKRQYDFAGFAQKWGQIRVIENELWMFGNISSDDRIRLERLKKELDKLIIVK